MKIHVKKKAWKRWVASQFKAGKINDPSNGTFRNVDGRDAAMGRDTIAGARHGQV